MKLPFPQFPAVWMAIGLAWVALSGFAWLRNNPSQAATNLSIGVVFALLGAVSKLTSKTKS